MMSLITTPEDFLPFIQTANAIVEEAKLRADEDGLHITAVDSANVAMVDVDIAPDAFDTYNVGAATGVIGVNLTRFEDIISIGDTDDILEISFNGDTRKLDIDVGNVEYNMATIDPASVRDEPEIPDLDLPGHIKCDWDAIRPSLDACDMVSDTVTFEIDSEGSLIIRSEGDTDDVRHVLVSELAEVDITEDGFSIFSLGYLRSVGRGLSKCDPQVTLELGNEFPTKIHGEFAEGNGNITYMVAPRIEKN